VEIHFQEHGWVAFDPTPRADAAMGFVTGRRWLRFGLEDYTGMSVAGTLAPLANRLASWQFPVQVWALAAGSGSLLLIIIMILRLLRRRIATGQELSGYSSIDGDSRRTMLKIYRRMVMMLVRNGLPPRARHETPDEYANLVSRRIPAGQNIVVKISQLAAGAAYDPKQFHLPDVIELKRDISVLRRVLYDRN